VTKIVKFLKPYMGATVAALFFSLFNNLMQLILPAMMALMINKGKWLIVAFLPLWYNIQRCRTQSGNRKGVYSWKLLYPFWFPLWQA
jgi:hypothetical protein